MTRAASRKITQEKSGVTVRHIGPVSRFSKKMGAATKAFYPLYSTLSFSLFLRSYHHYHPIKSLNPCLQKLDGSIHDPVAAMTRFWNPWAQWGDQEKSKIYQALCIQKKIRSVKFNILKLYTVKLTLIGGKSLGIDLWDKLLWRFLSWIKPLLPVDHFRG